MTKKVWSKYNIRPGSITGAVTETIIFGVINTYIPLRGRLHAPQGKGSWRDLITFTNTQDKFDSQAAYTHMNIFF